MNHCPACPQQVQRLVQGKDRRTLPICVTCDCNQHKPLSAFGVRKDRPCGVTPFCKECNRARWHEWSSQSRAAA